MQYPTHYLDWLLLLAGIFPSGLSYSLCYVFGADKPGFRQRWPFFALMLAPFIGLVLVLSAVKPDLLEMQTVPSFAVLVGLAAIPLAGAVEYGVGALPALVRAGPRPLGGVVLHQFWAGPLSPSQCAALVGIPIGEEFIFRKVDFHLLLGPSFSAPVWVVILVTSTLYALNHLSFGPVVAGSKLASGIVYGVAYLVAGSVVAPIIGHIGYNWGLIALLSRPRAHRTA